MSTRARFARRQCLLCGQSKEKTGKPGKAANTQPAHIVRHIHVREFSEESLTAIRDYGLTVNRAEETLTAMKAAGDTVADVARLTVALRIEREKAEVAQKAMRSSIDELQQCLREFRRISRDSKEKQADGKTPAPTPKPN